MIFIIHLIKRRKNLKTDIEKIELINILLNVKTASYINNSNGDIILLYPVLNILFRIIYGSFIVILY